MRNLLALCLFALSLSCSLAHGQIIAAGGGNDSAFLPILVERSGGKNCYIYIVAAAHEEKSVQQHTIDSYTSDFISLGVPPEHIYSDVILTKEDANTELVKSHVLMATAICVSGGDQHILLQRTLNTTLHKIILSKVAKGHIYYGTSAGTAAIGDLMISGDHDGKIVVEQGLGVVHGMVFEQHFTERKRAWRLKQFLESHVGYNGIGIDEMTAVIIDKEKNHRETVGKGKGHELALK